MNTQITEDHLHFLDGLRDAGQTNMHAAQPHLSNAYPELTEREVDTVLQYWHRTWAERHYSERG